MASEGRVVELREVVSLASGGTPSKQNLAFWGKGVPWVSAKDMGSYWIDETEDQLTDAGIAEATRLVPAGTVLILTRGMTLHKRVPICRVRRQASFNQDVKAILPKDGVASRFLPYLMTGNHDRLHALVDSAGHGTGRINTPELLSLKVWVPELREQEAIGRIGESLDDRIDLLRQTNDTLEAIAAALFKSWFVDFDPVRAKAEGREPEGMDAATAALFPTEFEESVLGRVPKGWGAVSADAIYDVGIGKTPPRKEPEWFSNQKGVRWVSIRDMGECGCFIAQTSERVTPEAVSRFNIRIVPDRTVLLSFKLTVGRVAITDGELVTNEAIAHFKPKLDSLPHTYLYFYLKSFNMERLGSTSSIATATNSKSIRGLQILNPGHELVDSFHALVNPLLERARHQQEQARTLTELRDTLLPRLISGKLRLPEAESIVDEAVA